MSYIWRIEKNGFELGVGRVFENFSIYIDVEKENIAEAIKNKDILLLDAFKHAYDLRHEIDAIQYFGDRFEDHFLQGSSWERAFTYSSFSYLSKIKSFAEIAINSSMCDDETKNVAIKFLKALDGDYPEHIPTDRDLINRKIEKYKQSRSKWLKLLIERDGYKCELCDQNKNLRIQHVISLNKGGETELNNLKLRCSKCINVR